MYVGSKQHGHNKEKCHYLPLHLLGTIHPKWTSGL